MESARGNASPATAYVAVLITAGSEEEAGRIAGQLVSARLAACVNILGPVRSVYEWEGEIHRDEETLLIAKSRRDRFETIVDLVSGIHSYEVPEILALPVEGASERYLAWMRDVLS